MKEYKVALVGCGQRGKAHADAYQHIPEAKLVACCDRSPERGEEMARRHGIRGYSDAKEMIRREKPDLVHLVTWPDVRMELMALVSEMGVPACTVEKPVATGVVDWKRLGELEAKSKTRFAVCHQFRWQKHLVKCQQALVGGTLGAVKMLDLSAGMNIAGQGTHALNYGMSLNGNSPVVSVFGNANGFANSDPRHPAPDRTLAYLTFANGVRGVWTSGDISPRCGGAESQFWQHVRVAAYAETGRVNYEEFGRWEIVGPAGKEEGEFGGMDEWQKNTTMAQAEFHKAMLRWIENPGDVPGTNLKQSLHEWAVVLALYQSAVERRPVELEGFDPPEDLFDRLVGAVAAK